MVIQHRRVLSCLGLLGGQRICEGLDNGSLLLPPRMYGLGTDVRLVGKCLLVYFNNRK